VPIDALRESWQRLVRIVATRRESFVIGRTAVRRLDRLSGRYRSNVGAYVLHVGPRAEMASLEVVLQMMSRDQFGDRCLNHNFGGGGQTADKWHAV
jgi:hypothetical protein